MLPGVAGACLRPRASSPALDDLLGSVLALREIGPDTFAGRRPAQSIDRIYGGETLAQGIRAAANTVPAQRQLHSCHINFLRLGDPADEVVCTVERLRDSAQFSTRQVRVTQAAV